MQLIKCAHPECNNIPPLSSKGEYKKYCSNSCKSKIGYKKYVITMLEKYGVENIAHLDECKNKRKETNIKKYGVENPSQRQEVKDKKKETCNLHFGTDHFLKSEIGKQKVKNTNLKKYGVENPFQTFAVKEKMKKYYQSEFGVDFVGQVPEIKEKIKNTNLEKYGVENQSQRPEIQNKIMAKGLSRKEYKFNSGKTVLVQGYENLALDHLLTRYTENDIIIGDATHIPVIKFLDENNQERTYFPDIFIPRDNLLIEVKSTYTYEKDKAKNLLKKQACEKLGYKFEFFIGHLKR